MARQLSQQLAVELVLQLGVLETGRYDVLHRADMVV